MKSERKFEFTRGLPEELENLAVTWLEYVVSQPLYRNGAFGLAARRVMVILQNGDVPTVLSLKRAHFFDKKHPVFSKVRAALHPDLVAPVANDPKGGGSWLILAVDNGQQCLVPVKEDVVLSGRAVVRAHNPVRVPLGLQEGEADLVVLTGAPDTAAVGPMLRSL